jgi:hypothetical protein
MSVTIGFFKSLARWTAALVLLLSVMQIVAGGEPSTTGAGRLALSLYFAPHWLTFALAQCAFPAGVSVAPWVISENWELRAPAVVRLLAATLGLALLIFLLAHFVSPAALRPVFESRASEPSTMTLPELHAARDAAVREAQRATGATQPSWLRANQLDWQLQHRHALALLAPLLAWLGVLAGAWARRLQRRELRYIHLWGMGFFLLVGIYGFLENSYEAIVVRMAGPAAFAGWFVLVVPAVLFVGLAWPTWLVLAESAKTRSATSRGRDDRVA